MKQKWFFAENSNTWLNLMQMEAIYRVNNQWTVRSITRAETPITDAEYWAIADILRATPEHKE